MVRTATLVVSIVWLLCGSGASAAGSKCDSGVTKAAGKKVQCITGAIASGQSKGVPPSAKKVLACQNGFNKACTKAKGDGDCVHQTETCAQEEANAETSVS